MDTSFLSLPIIYFPLEEKKLLRKSLLFPFLFVSALWLIKLSEVHFKFSLGYLGIKPRTVEGLIGIFTLPFIHANYDHLLSNTLPLLVVGTGINYFYREISFRVNAFIYLLTGFWVWLAARPDFHIGASGLIYGFVCFLFFSGIFRKDRRLLAISLLVTFLYGSMVWGILPVDQTISWESHLFGSVAGLVAAIYFRHEGPQQKPHVWDEDDTPPTEPQYWMTDEQKKKIQPENQSSSISNNNSGSVNYFYTEEEKDYPENPNKN